ncbi:hypothetical protein EZV62_016437 [Acer yangbiense]|uniref:Dol-P-Glc:Glc(2)Man(9)GlcNAc(2)-PP-Dol alpha-1,2-glucosyltransferase n=1 Tax=Acer yangbiense TaxID=1000413 RepID=A0A5C7HP88_9ROSI|nr:hypothetical protein EZV62_016437 [Acer yangbiense]
MGRIAVAAIVSMWVIPVSILVNRVVPDSYMDEIFHIPQAQQYCKGNFKSWDPMITTPPGLYYLSLANVASLFPGMFFVQPVSSYLEVCSTAVLRSTNGVLAVLCSFVIYEIITHLRPALDDRKATLQAVVLALYPLHWFFTFLYYTDVASLTAVLAMYLACLKKKYQLSALLGALAVTIRQTNIIWMLFVACTGVIDITLADKIDDETVEDSYVSIRTNDRLTSTSRVTMGSNLRKRKSDGAVDKSDMSMPRTSTFSTTQKSGLLDEMRAIILTSWHMKWEILVSFSPFFLALVCFVAFVYWNGSVVLGAKEAHAVSPHFAQIMYFSLVSALFTAPVLFSLGQVATLFRSFWKNRPLVKSFTMFCAMTLYWVTLNVFTIPHPYLFIFGTKICVFCWCNTIESYEIVVFSLKSMFFYIYIYIFTQRTSDCITNTMILSLFLKVCTRIVFQDHVIFDYRSIRIAICMLIMHAGFSNRKVNCLYCIFIPNHVTTLYITHFRVFNPQLSVV